MERDLVVETNAAATQQRHIEALDAWTQHWRDKPAERGGPVLRISTDDQRIHAALRILCTVGGNESGQVAETTSRATDGKLVENPR